MDPQKSVTQIECLMKIKEVLQEYFPNSSPVFLSVSKRLTTRSMIRAGWNEDGVVSDIAKILELCATFIANN